MWPDTALTRLFGIRYPLIQAPMAGSTTPELAAAVSNAGGLGSLGCAMMTPDRIRAAIRRTKELTREPFNVNLFAPEDVDADPGRVAEARAALAPFHKELGLGPVPEPARANYGFAEQLDAVLAEGAPVFSFTFNALPRETVARCRRAGSVVLGTANTVREAKALEESGVDAVVAQGTEAGGHRGTFIGEAADGLIGLVALVPQMADALKVPVIAAGGIMDSRGVVAGLALGAAAVQLGTAFMFCPEATVNPAHRAAMKAADDDATTLTAAYTGRAARALRNRFTAAMAGRPIAPHPVQRALTAALREAAVKNNDSSLMYMLAGQASRLGRELPAGELVAKLAAETAALLKSLDPVR